MDWDLQAPGLHRYFKPFMANESFPQEGLIHLLSKAAENSNTEWQPFVAEVKIPDCSTLHIIASGDRAPDYVERVRLFSWTSFFENRRGGEILDRWRDEWRESYDFVLVDSRTGITDTGGSVFRTLAESWPFLALCWRYSRCRDDLMEEMRLMKPTGGLFALGKS